MTQTQLQNLIHTTTGTATAHRRLAGCSVARSGRMEFLVEGVEQRLDAERLVEMMPNPFGSELGVALGLARLIG